MPTKSVKLNVLTSGVDRAMSDMEKLSASKTDLGKGATIRLTLENGDLTADKLEALKLSVKDLSDKGANIYVKLEGGDLAEGELAGLKASADELSMSGAKVSGSFKNAGSDAEGFGSKLKGALGGALGMGALGGLAVGLGLSAKVALDAQANIAALGNAIHDAGGNVKTYQSSIDATEASMAKFGDTGSEVDAALTIMIHATGNVTLSESAMATAANLAASRHISLASATSMLAKAAGGAMKGLKDLGIVQVTGATSAKAMQSAQTTLMDQFKSAGSAAQFAADHHMSLVKALGLLNQATQGANAADSELANHNLTVAQATTLVTAASLGSSTAAKTLTKDHLSLASAQNLVATASGGNIKAYNELGIVVLPKTATAAERLAQVQSVLNDKLGGAAAAQAATFQGRMSAIRAQFTDMAEKIGLAVLPALTSLLGGFSKLLACKPIMDVLIGVVGLLALAFVYMKIQAVISAVATKEALISSGVGILLIALSVAVMELMAHWRGLATGVREVWHDITAVSDTFFHWIKQNWELLLAGMLAIATGGLSLIALEVYKHWHDITTWTGNLWHDVVNIWLSMGHDIEHVWGNTWSWLSNAFSNFIGTEERGFVLFWDDLKNAADNAGRWIYDRVSGWWNNLVGNARQAWNTMVSDITGIWGKVENAVAGPIRWIANNVWNKFARVVDAVTRFLSLGSPVPVLSLAEGGRIPGYGGGDVLPALLERGETIVDKNTSKDLAPVFAAAGVPGYQFGGIIGDITNAVGSAAKSAWGGIKDVGSFAKSLVLGGVEALAKPVLEGMVSMMGSMPGASSGFGQVMEAIPKYLVNHLLAWMSGEDKAAGSGSSIVSYAESFIGKVPYVWGGTSPSGWDCSGFTSYVYDHFGYHPPRTSESQFGWVKHTPTAIPGGLAFFAGSDGTVASPGHVGIIVNGNKMVDAYGTGYGTRYNTIVGSSGGISGYGVPPTGFTAGASGGVNSPGSMTASAIAALWIAQGGPAYAAQNMSRIAAVESADVPGVIQKGEPPGLTGYGLYQITPTSGIWQNGKFGNLLNAANNTKAAIYLFKAAGGYGPWTSDPVGSSLVAGGLSYGTGGVINEMVAGMGMSSGRSYTFGETGPELVTPVGGRASGAANGGDTININIGLATDPNATAQTIHQLLRRYKTKKGGGPLGLD